jgi:Tfp pilus assembly protein FimT
VRFNCDCQACYAQFKVASRVAVSVDGGGEREMSEADRLREELRLARAASAAAGRPVEADDSTASSNA